MKILITGGAGFIGSALIRYIISHTNDTVINVDKLTYAGNLSALESVSTNPRYHFEQADICDSQRITEIFAQYQPDVVMHLAAESHVDRSIQGSAEFMQTNILGTYQLLEISRAYWVQKNTKNNEKSAVQKIPFLFHHISTDEVYGDLATDAEPFLETHPYQPSSPYSASKAGSDHLVRAWHRTYGLPVVITNCSNNYGMFQHQEKLIPLMILNALQGKLLPIYGAGLQIRDWLFVDDHVKALYKVVTQGKIGETYNIGGNCEKTNLEVVHLICDLLEELAPQKPKNVRYYRDLITHVEDRLGHDQRYAINSTKIQQELGWKPEETFESGLRKTVEWYLTYYRNLTKPL